MGEKMTKVLVAYATKSGCTTGIAEKIGQTFAQRGMDVDVKAASEAGDPSGYDAVIVGSGVRAGSWHGAAREWVTANAEALRARPTAFFTCCLTMAAEPDKCDEVRAYTDKLIAETGVEPVDIGLFAGWNQPNSFPFLERSIMKLMKAPEGDFRDLEAVAGWTEGIAERIA